MIGWTSFTDEGILPKSKHSTVNTMCRKLIPCQFSVFPWGSLQEDTFICDVGGGNGHAALDLLKAHPHLKAVVQDLATLRLHWNEVRKTLSTAFEFTDSLMVIAMGETLPRSD